ncbi:pyrroline-5-carboxylate reductase [uncultured Clostridium sp.]|jgi:pyrroline-5-carboxylate reductase|uniref:pyrroline-5-carboxylate reductase n=1 Tax=uncultured Clostridium sp. TaxID=59620 RepID=UPI00260BD6B2|nr:pyrroline-5-carboxylate reductase [uncultured Clostridium sp.]
MSKKIGFIGCGNMGGAMLEGILKAGIFDKESIFCSAKSEESKKNISEKFGVNVADNTEVTRNSDILILAVKPHFFSEVIKEIKDYVRADTIIVSIAAGVGIEDIQSMFGIYSYGLKVVRTMPNTPALVGEGMSAICANKNVTDIELEEIQDIFNSFGKSEILEEKYFHGFIALCGSSPAYGYMFIEAMGTAGIKAGIPANKSYKLAAQSLLGTAKMVLETGEHPAVLKDRVCSPSGTTIEAVSELENAGFRKAIIGAMEACEKKSKEMQKK